MTGWLIYDENGYDRNRWFADRLAQHLGCRTIIVQRLEFGVENGIYYKYEGKLIKRPDYAVQRSIYPLLSQTLEWDGVRVFNSAGVCEICNDKRKTHLLACKLGIPTAKTAFSDKKLINIPQMPFVLKSAAGHGGSEVFMVQNEQQFRYAVDFINEDGILFQRPVSDAGIDKRVYVMGDKILASVERRAKNGFKSNFSLGGSAELSEVSAEEREIVFKMINKLRPDFVGIDFIYDEGRPFLNEVEDIVGTRMLYELTDIDSAENYAQYILTEMNKK